MRTYLISPICLSLALTTSAAFAEDSGDAENSDAKDAENESDGSKMNFNVAPAQPAPARTAYVHEGGYFRVNVGSGFMHTTLVNKLVDASASSTAFSLNADLLAGLSPSPGVTLGGGAMTTLALSSEFNSTSGGGLLNILAGPFFDAFPDPKGGFHLGAMVGFSGLSLSDSVSNSSFLAGGGVNGWVGYDWWVAPEWSAGFEIKSGGGYMVGTDMGASVFNMQAVFTLLHH